MKPAQMNGMTNFEGIQFSSSAETRRFAAAAGGYAVMIEGNCYVVPEHEVGRLQFAGVDLRIIYSPDGSHRRTALPEKGLSAGTPLGR
jgi:hypothetical protein